MRFTCEWSGLPTAPDLKVGERGPNSWVRRSSKGIGIESDSLVAQLHAPALFRLDDHDSGGDTAATGPLADALAPHERAGGEP
jgi:hypothetical protein